MSKGISIHIGLNAIDPAHYNTTGKLTGCENDARAMHKIATSLGYEPTTLLTKEATAARVLSEIFRASQKLKHGDSLLITYAGHGTQVPDISNEEEDKKDETWCLYDRMLIDDELYSAWANFHPGVQITVISDSCHSGTVTREILLNDLIKNNYPEDVLYRCFDPQEAELTFDRYKYWYSGIKMGIPRSVENKIRATVLLISGCQDNQLAGDGPNNGLFTSKLLEIWNDGKFTGNYRAFHEKICSLMPAVQTPNYLIVGTDNPGFESRKPFSLIDNRIIEGDESMVSGRPRMFSWNLDIEESTIRGMSNDQIKIHLKNMVDIALMPAYEKYQLIESQIILPRGGEITGGCTVGDKGWSCGVGGSIRF